ncbi:MAG: TIGR03936 family radical SAM-associated protein [Cyanobacteria bacterium]|nr:TIGR03936 family radical SAM-associated protein [Cyanobacteriota bacterium]
MVTSSTHVLETEILPHVAKPGRYIGLEQGTFNKSFEKAAVTMAATFPELYEIGFSNYGLKLLYSLVNQQPDYMCDRVYAPALDFKEALGKHHIPLFAVESKQALVDFDLLAFSLQYELNYTTILGLLESACIQFRAEDRKNPMPERLCGVKSSWPILIAGGPGSANPMPLSPFFDAFILGDGEEVLLEILDYLKQVKAEKKWDRESILSYLATVEGIYVPGKSQKAYKRIVDIAEKPVTLAPLIPTVGAVHDRVVVEARRGCDRMCRFCQPCFINLPVREQSIETIKESALRDIEKTGYEECSLLSLSIADYSYFKPMILEVADALKEKNVSLSLPSQRADRFSLEVADAVQSVRKSTLTFAPEAGTARMRDVINKNLSDEEIMNAVTTAYQAGWNKVKLYFMIGLPTETTADLDGILDTVRRMKQLCAAIRRDEATNTFRQNLEVNVTISNFVPKPHTPFQWFPQDSLAQLHEKIRYIKEQVRASKGSMSGVKFNFTDPELSKLEALISKGDNRLADVIERAYSKGAYLDAWEDVRSFDKWFESLKEVGLDPEVLTQEIYTDPDDPLPWAPIDMGLTHEWLKTEYERAVTAASTTPCFETCSTCGVCATYTTWPKFIETPKHAGNGPIKLKEIKLKEKNPASEKRKHARFIDVSDRPEQLQKEPVVVLRLIVEKRGRLRFISHLDWLRMLHRVVSRAKLPVAYSQGFNPKPKIGFSPALSMLMESSGELVDIELTEAPGQDQVHAFIVLMNQLLPEGGRIQEGTVLPWPTPSIDRSIVAVNYIARWTCNDPDIEGKMKEIVADLAGRSSLPVTVQTKQSTKSFDLIPYLSECRMADFRRDGSNGLRFSFKTRFQPKDPAVFIKPDWLLSNLDPQGQWPDLRWSVTRTGFELSQKAFTQEFSGLTNPNDN